jgi:hypothetical protein
MPFGYETKSNEDAYILVNIKKSDKTFRLPKYSNSDTIENYIKNFFSIYSQYQKAENLTAKTRDILGAIVTMFDLESYDFKLKINSSSFYANSKAMKSPYWTKEWELFARAFETYVFDKLVKSNRANNYLVSGGYFDREEGVYPMGQERDDLFVLYDALIDKIKLEYDLSGFKSWTNEKVDEYFVLDDKGDEESGVIVDDESGEVIETVSDYTSFQNKLLILEEMITSSTK